MFCPPPKLKCEMRILTLVRDICFNSLRIKNSSYGIGVHSSVTRTRFKRRTLHVPNLKQMSENNRFFSFVLDSAYVKFDV